MLILGILIGHLFLLLNLKFTAWPEMLLWPYMTIHALLPYKDAAIVHTPHLVIDLAVIYKIFGVGLIQLKVYTWSLIIFSDLVVYWVVKRFWNKKIAISSVLLFAIWQLFFDGNGIWFDLILVPLALITFYLVKNKRYFWAGMFWAFMFFTKQTAVFFLIPIFLSIKKWKEFVFGTVFVLLIWTLILAVWGNLSDFYHWAIWYAIFVLPRAQGQIQLPDVKSLIISLFPFLIFVPLIIKTKTKNISLLLWAVAGMMGAYPRFEYFHFQPALPFLAIAGSLGVADIGKEKKFIKVFLLFYFIGSLYLFANFFVRNWEEGTRFYEQEVVDVVRFVKANTKPEDKIFVMNWWDNIYPLTGTYPATDPWVPQLSWYQELPGIQEKEVSDLEKSKPKLILLQDYTDSGLASYKPQKVYDYVMVNYKFRERIDGINVLVPNK